MLAVKNHLKFETLELTSFSDLIPLIDIVGCKLILKLSVVYLLVVYVPPSVSYDIFEMFLDRFMLLDTINDKKIIVVGDFNIPHFNTDPNESKSKLMNNFIEILNLHQYNNIKNVNNRTLDLVLSNISCDVTRNFEPFVEEDVHHPTLTFDFRVSEQHNKSFPVIDSRSFNFKKANFPLMYELISNMDWSYIQEFRNVNDLTQHINCKLRNIFDLSVPLRINRQRRYPQWFSSEIVTNIRRKENALKNLKKYKTEYYHQKFISLRARVKTEIDRAYRSYVSETEDNITSDPSMFWTYIQNKKGKSRIPNIIKDKDNNFTYDNPQDIVNAFGYYFQSVYKESDSSLVKANEVELSNLPNININQITELDIVKASKKLKNKLTSGIDGIPSLVIKDCISVLAKPLAYLFNLIISTSTFPEMWKTARICPILKKGDSCILQNYRAISILCNFSKLLEIILYNIIYNSTKHVITIDQHGFVEKRSCVTNLSCLSQYISEALDKQMQVDVVYLDFQKAFDQIDHYILLYRLEYFGLSDSLLNLLKSYLINRKQFVVYEGLQSFFITPSSGVPQGSNLGPLLFLLFIDNLARAINCQKLFYADDLKLFNLINSVNDCLILQNNINIITDWCVNNHLYLNVSKCCVMSFTKRMQSIEYQYQINHTALIRSLEIKDLGILFDEKLNFITYISNIVSSANRMLGFIIRNCRHFRNLLPIKLLYFAYVRSKLEYGALIWYPLYQCHIDAVESVQRKFLKYLSFKINGTYPEVGISYSLLLNQHQFVSLHTRRKCISVMFLYNLLHNNIDCPELLNRVNFLVPRLEARYSPPFYCENARTNVLCRSPLSLMQNNFNVISRMCDINITSLASILQFVNNP